MNKRSSDVQKILDAFRRIVRVLRESSRAAEERFGLSGAQLFVLQTLARQPELSLNALAEHTRTHQSTVSVVVSRLVERGLVRRAAAPDDARRLVLALTQGGKELIARAPGAAQERLIDAIVELPGARRAQLGRALDELVALMEVGDRPAGMLFDDADPAAARPASRARRKRP